jgi:hypothetical protein
MLEVHQLINGSEPFRFFERYSLKLFFRCRRHGWDG